MVADIYGGQDPIDVPAYSIRQAAHYLKLPPATMRAWTLGRYYPCGSEKKYFAPLIAISDPKARALSFRNVVEIHVLSVIRRKHKVELPNVRAAIEYLSERSGANHPLAIESLLTDGVYLFVEQYGKLVNLSMRGQLEMKSLIEIYISRIDRDPSGLPFRFFPFTRHDVSLAPKSVVLNPRLQFGRPCLSGTGIPTSIVAERFIAGETVEELAKDFGQPAASIDEAIRFECAATAA
jgi:uncharacterized protein (DUF433 family)